MSDNVLLCSHVTSASQKDLMFHPIPIFEKLETLRPIPVFDFDALNRFLRKIHYVWRPVHIFFQTHRDHLSMDHCLIQEDDAV